MKKNYVEKSLNAKKEFEEEIDELAEELKDLLVNYIEIYKSDDETNKKIKELLALL